MKFNSRWLDMVSFKACRSVESLEKPAQLVLLICRCRQWNNLLHFHPPSSLYLYWVMMGKWAALDVAFFPGVSKALLFRPLCLCAPNLSGLFFFFLAAPELIFILCIQHKANIHLAKSSFSLCGRQDTAPRDTRDWLSGGNRTQSKENCKIYCSESSWARPWGMSFHCTTAPGEAIIMSCT